VPGGRSVQNPYTQGNFVPVSVVLDHNGRLLLLYGGVPVFANLPTGFTPEAGDRFGFGARTGGLNAEHRIDNIVINTVIPEPAGLSLLGLGGLLLTRRRRA
jgi:hypothetical protein